MPIEAAALASLGWVASPIVKDLVNKSISYLGTNIAKGLEDLETTLLPQFELTIQAAQHSSHKAQLAKWLVRLKNAYYDAEGILHELEYERLKRKAKGKDKKLLVRLSSKPNIKPLAKFVGRVIKKASLLSPQKRKLLKRLNKLKEIAAEAKNFRDLLGIQNTENIQNVSNNNIVTTSLLGNADKIFGRDGDRDEIINFLLNEQGGSSSTKSYSVVAVTGMGGAGKTVLSQYVYNDPRVQNYFDVRMWLCLPEKFDIIEVTKQMIEGALGERLGQCNLNYLQEKLVKALPNNKKVMVVLDDIWYDNDVGAGEKKKWENLLKPFDSRGGICKIVVTSRSSWSFPIELQPVKLIQLRHLAPDDFKSLFRYHAIDDLQFSNPQVKNDFSNIVDQIAQNISKLPLAAKVVGNQLRNQPNIRFWQATLEKLKLSDIMEILLWSFHRFDVQLQRCFLFCSVFPKGTRYDLDSLVPYWVALDFISPSGDNRNVEDIGLEYFQKMVANSIFNLVDKTYIMHDFFHDLAKELSTEDCFSAIDAEKTIPEREIPSTVQHVFFRVNNEHQKENLSSISHLSNLRTLILGCSFIDDISEIILKISTSFRNLRVLDVVFLDNKYKTLPRVVGNLRNLQLLYLRQSKIEELPDSLLQLYHLQFLYLPSSVKTLPTKFSNLIKLRSIEMYNEFGDPTLPPVPYLGKLTALQNLNEFHVRKEKGYELQQLGHLNEIGGSLRIVNLENVRHNNEAVEARLIDKSNLKELKLVWAESAENGLEIEVIEALRPPTNLELLVIDGYGGSRYPTWLKGGSFMENIKDVRFYNCNALTILPSNFHQFRHCSEFHLYNLGALRELSTFPESLTKLFIINCPCLIFVCENEVRVNENKSSFEQFLTWSVRDTTYKSTLDHELKSFEQTCSKENYAEQFEIMKKTGWDNASPELWVNVNKAWWRCHQQRMNFIFSLPPEKAQVNKLKLPSKLCILDLGYCCVSDGALSSCLRGMVTLEELYLRGIMTITTLPLAEVFVSLQMLRFVEIRDCWYLRSLGGLHALPNLKSFWVVGGRCLEMDSGHTPLPPTLQSFSIVACVVPQDIFNGNLPCLQDVLIINCHFPSSLSFRQLTSLKSLSFHNCPDIRNRIISGLQSYPTLEYISFGGCPEISELPELPRSVQRIRIWGCPVLTERCQPNGPDWHKIQYIEDRDIE